MVHTRRQNIHKIKRSLKAKQKSEGNLKLGEAYAEKRGTKRVEEVVGGEYDQYILYLYVKLSSNMCKY